MKHEGRHIDFYAGQATQRLEGHRGAARDPRRAAAVLGARRVWDPARSQGALPRLSPFRLIGRAGCCAADRPPDRHRERDPGAGAQPTAPLAIGALSGATTPPAGSTVTISLCADSTEVPRLNASPSRGFGPSRPSEMGWSPICAHSW